MTHPADKLPLPEFDVYYTDFLREVIKTPWSYSEAQLRAHCRTAYDAGRASVLAEGTPFGYWHQAPDPDECEFFLADDVSGICGNCIPLYTHPAAQTARLTDAQIEDCADAASRSFREYNSSKQGWRPQMVMPADHWNYHLARAIEAALKGQA